MLRIKMDRRDVSESAEEIAAAGYRIDKRGRSGMDFVFFIHDEASPKNKDEALKFLHRTFFHLPYDIWVDGKKID